MWGVVVMLFVMTAGGVGPSPDGGRNGLHGDGDHGAPGAGGNGGSGGDGDGDGRGDFTLCTSLYALNSMRFTLCTSLYALRSMHFTQCT